MKIDKTKLKDELGRPLTQSLFLEFTYSPNAVYTLKHDDFEYEGKFLPSIRKLYLEIGDPTEYKFANECFLGWKHWLRLYANKAIQPYVDDWREELEVKLRSEGIDKMLALAREGKFDAARWMAARGWEDRTKGRPTKDQIEKNLRIEERLQQDYNADVIRLIK